MALKVVSVACLYGKRLDTSRFELKILMSTIISLGVFYRDLLSLFSLLVGDVSFGLLMRFFLSCFFQFWKLFPFHKTWIQLPPFLLRGLAFSAGFLSSFFGSLSKKINYCLFALLLAVCWNVFPCLVPMLFSLVLFSFRWSDGFIYQ